jgi:hypothetical protein
MGVFDNNNNNPLDIYINREASVIHSYANKLDFGNIMEYTAFT